MQNGIYLPTFQTIRPTNKGYSEAGASTRKKALKGFTAMSGSPREDIDYNNYTLRQRGRILTMSTPLAASAIKTNRTNIVGCGLQLKCTVDRDVLGWSQEQAEEWERHTENEFAIWAENKDACDATGINDWYAMQQLALGSWLTSGDVFGVLKQAQRTTLNPYALRVHIVEADRVSTPHTAAGDLGMFLTDGVAANGNRIYDGVEVDSGGKIVAYYIRNTYPFQITAIPTEWQRVEAYGQRTGLPNIVQVMESERPDQYRGVTYLAPVIEQLLQIRRYTESELTAAVVESFFTAFVATEGATDGLPFNETGGGSGDRRVADGENEYEMGPGQINVMKPGESVSFADPKRPSNGFQTFVNAISEQIGAALELPSDLLRKAFNSSYSASRAALLEAWKAFKMKRDWFTTDFCRPIYAVWLSEAAALGRVNAPGFFSDPLVRAAYLGSEWIGPSQGQLDPVKEITAEILACSEGFSTHEQSTIKLNGGQWASNVDQLARENEKLTAAGAGGSGAAASTGAEASGTAVENAVRKLIMDTVKKEETEK
nr:MAG TPA: portal protein [Caudoviricetes sp.]